MSSKSAAGRASKELLLDVLQLVLDKSRIDPALAKKLRYARTKGYVRREGISHLLTQKGREMLSENKIWELSVPRPRRWDGKWHFVLFDIPADKRKRRDIFRTRLKEMGLTLYQNSVWVYPYPLEKEVREIAVFYKLSPCVSFITAEEITGEAGLIQLYEL